MIKTVNDLIKDLQNLREDLKDKPVYVEAKNGLRFYPEVRFKKKDKYKFDLTKENVESVWIGVWD